MTSPRRCKDCAAEGVTTSRPVVPNAPGPRCSTHARAWRKRSQSLSHARKVQNGYGITGEDYWRLYEAQGGHCWVCQKATGKTKRLAVEHEHNLEGCEHPPEKGCRRCIRALTCSRCNRLVAFLDVPALVRAIELLTNPPARKVLNP